MNYYTLRKYYLRAIENVEVVFGFVLRDCAP